MQNSSDEESTSRAPTLPSVFSVEQGLVTDAHEHDENGKPTLPYKEHASQLLAITGPIILSEIFQNLMPVVDIAFVGRLGKDELASAGLATVWFNLWNATLLGFSTAVDTFLAQAYGANELGSYAMWTGNSLVIVFLATFVVAGLIASCEPCMILFGQDKNLAAAAGEFSYRLLPGLFPYYIFKVLTKYLQSQDIISPGIIVGFLANGFNILANWLLIYKFGLGLNGAPWATTLTRVIQLLLLLGYMYWRKNRLADTWPLFSVQNLKYSLVKPFLKLAISGALSFGAEEWSFEVTTILAGLINTVALDGHVITLNIATFTYLSFSFAVGIATSIKVGQFAGEGKGSDTQRSSIVAFAVNFVLHMVLIVILWSCSRILADTFTEDEEVADLVTSLMPFVCIFMLGDAFQATIEGIMRGLGRQKLVFLLNMLSYWVLAIPFGSILTFATNIGVSGLWWGFTLGISAAAIIGMFFLKFRINWENEVLEAQKRVSNSNGNMID